MPADIKAQTRQSLSNVKAILEAAGTSMENVVKSTVFLADMSLFGPMNEVYAEFFCEPFPARCAFAVKELPKAGPGGDRGDRRLLILAVIDTQAPDVPASGASLFRRFTTVRRGRGGALRRYGNRIRRAGCGAADPSRGSRCAVRWRGSSAGRRDSRLSRRTIRWGAVRRRDIRRDSSGPAPCTALADHTFTRVATIAGLVEMLVWNP